MSKSSYQNLHRFHLPSTIPPSPLSHLPSFSPRLLLSLRLLTTNTLVNSYFFLQHSSLPSYILHHSTPSPLHLHYIQQYFLPPKLHPLPLLSTLTPLHNHSSPSPIHPPACSLSSLLSLSFQLPYTSPSSTSTPIPSTTTSLSTCSSFTPPQ